MDNKHQDISNQLKYMHPENETVELRIKGVKNQISNYWQRYAGGKGMVGGYFRDYKNLAELAHAVDEESKPEAVYILLNQCNNDLYARSADCLCASPKSTTDADIIRYKNLLIDIDPKRAAGISSTDQQLKCAIAKARIIRDELSILGWPLPLMASSGNGAHLIYKIDLEPVPENTELLKKVLNALAHTYDDEKTVVDTTVFNPSRITKLYGTVARKGSNTTERPYRCSQIIDIPEESQTVIVGLLKQIIDIAPEQQPTEQVHRQMDDSTQNFNVQQYLEDYGWQVIKTEPHGTSTLYCLEQCVFNSSHKGNEAAIGQKENGELFYQCFHASCKGKTWYDAREIISGQDKLTKYMKKIVFDEKLGHNKFKNNNQTFSAVELSNPDIKPPSYIVHNLITQGLSLLVGKPKKGKSFMALNIALSIVKGEKVFGSLEVDPGAVLYLALEDGRSRLQQRLFKIQGHGKFPEQLHFAIIWDRIDQGGLENIAKKIEEIKNLKLIIIDTLAKIRPAKSGKDVYLGDYTTINNLKHVADTFDIPILVLHHQRKSGADDIFDTVSGSLGITGAADTIMILDRKNNTTQAELMITGRDVIENTFTMNFNETNCSWEITGNADTVRLNQAEENIVQLIDENGGCLSSKIILSSLKPQENESTIRWRLSEMVKKGILYRDGVGVYKNNPNNTNITNMSNTSKISNIPNSPSESLNIGSIGYWNNQSTNTSLYINNSITAANVSEPEHEMRE
jgi:hypothetical protein